MMLNNFFTHLVTKAVARFDDLEKVEQSASWYFRSSTMEEKEKLLSSILQLAKLESNWDGYGAEAFQQSTLENALKFINQLPDTSTTPEMSPTNNGTIEFFWESDTDEASLEIGRTKFSFYRKYEGKASEYLEGQVISASLGLERYIPESGPATVLDARYFAKPSGGERMEFGSNPSITSFSQVLMAA